MAEVRDSRAASGTPVVENLGVDDRLGERASERRDCARSNGTFAAGDLLRVWLRCRAVLESKCDGRFREEICGRDGDDVVGDYDRVFGRDGGFLDAHRLYRRQRVA